MNTPHDLIQAALASRLTGDALDFFTKSAGEIAEGVEPARFSVLLAKASRYAPRQLLSPNAAEQAQARGILAGWSMARWSTLDAMRVVFVLSLADLAEAPGQAAIEEAFRYADEGESCALFRAIPLCPGAERFVWRVSDGCRTNMTSVFEAIAFDSPFPVTHFDDVAWQQLVIKAVFVGVNLACVHGLDGRLSPELARIALDLVEERRSAGRDVQSDLWMTLGKHAGERGLALIECELREGKTVGRCAAALALARAGETKRLSELASRESDPRVAEVMERALAGTFDQYTFEHLNLSLQESN